MRKKKERITFSQFYCPKCKYKKYELVDVDFLGNQFYLLSMRCPKCNCKYERFNYLTDSSYYLIQKE